MKAASAEDGEAATFHVSKEVTILAISLYVMGLGTGPLLLGPLSEFYGRNPVYYVSYTLFLAFSFPVAFAPNAGTYASAARDMLLMCFIAVFLIFRFIQGFAGAAFLSVAGGSVSDLFDNEHVPKLVVLFICIFQPLKYSPSPMAVYTASPFLGPVVGPLFSGYAYI